MLAFNKAPRERLLAELDQSLSGISGSGRRLALLILNLRRFRQINIAHGHAVGDTVLAQTVQRIQAALRPGDSVVHLGNDEFAVLLKTLPTPQVAKLAADKILETVAEPIAVEGASVSPLAFVGAAVYPDHADSRDALLRAADSALHHARDQGLKYAVYDTRTRSEELRSAQLKRALQSALDNGELQLHYQPQLDLRKGVLCGGEALARWKHAELGAVRPDVFVDVAERYGLIDSLTYWSLNVALREWFQVCDACRSTSVAVNLSASLLHSRELVPMVERTLNIWGARPGEVVLEVTESAMMIDPGAALHTLSALHEMGITLSIDDFGTGYSSLAYLKKLPVSELKIDKSFVLHMARNPQDRKIVQSIIDLAHTLDMQVVAEGIEDADSLELLTRMGCDFGQGYYIARPMPLSALAAWSRDCPWDTAPLPTPASEAVDISE